MPLRENLSSEPVRRMNLRTPVLVDESVSVRDAVNSMRAAQLGCAIMVDHERKPIGMFTEGMLRKKLASDTRFIDAPLGEHVARTFPWVALDDPVEMVLDAMRTNNTRFICVVDEQQKVAGLTGQKGLMEYISEHFPRQVVVQRVGGDEYAEQREGA
jgi:CBS domain-containing protein